MQLPRARTMARSSAALGRTPRSSLYLASVLIFVVVSAASVAEAIVKQQQQQQQTLASSAASQQQQQGQQRSDDGGQSAIVAQQQSQGYNHQAPASTIQQAAQQSGSGVQQQPQVQSSNSYTQGNLNQAAAGGLGQTSQQSSYGSAPNQKQQQPQYLDSMAAAASNTEQSYQAAAQSVNMALANSGILNNGGNGGYQSGSLANQPTSGSANNGGQQQNAAALNPLHYFYYPAAKESIQGPSKQADAMASSASTNQQQYQPYAGPPNYVDQAYSSPFSGLGNGNGNGNGGPLDMAASGPDASFLSQPGMNEQQPQQVNNQQLNNNNNNNNQQQQHNFNSNQGINDLTGYASSNQMQQQQPPASQQPTNTISFGGPSNGQQPSGGIQNGAQNDYLAHFQGGNQPSGSGVQPSYQQNAQNMFNQLASGGDLSTSNFGNNAGGLSSIASYMAPNGGNVNQAAQNAHELFANSFLNSAAASQLSASSISPPSQQPGGPQQQQPSQQPSSLFSAGANLFGGGGGQSNQQPGNGGLYGASVGNNGQQSYLSSYLSPSQLSALASEVNAASPMSLANAISLQNQQQPAIVGPSSVSSSGSTTAAATSSKRFGIGSFIMPMLALAGLSLLIPTMSNLGTAVGRKKRSVVEEKASASNRAQQINFEPLLSGSFAGQLLKENSIGEYLDRIERYYGIYRNAIESDECMSRLVCEFGDAVKDLTNSGRGPLVMSVLERLVPNWMTGKMHLFKEAAMNNKESKDKCKKYVCHNVAGHGGSRQH